MTTRKRFADDDDKTQTELGSQTCFSSEQEKVYQAKKPNFFKKTLKKVATGFPKMLVPPQTDETQNKSKWEDLLVRTRWTIIMMLVFFFILFLGNFYCAIFVLLVIMAIHNELVDLYIYIDRNKEVKNYYLVSWYFFFLCIYYFYVKLVMDKLTYLQDYPVIRKLLVYHSLIGFMLYILGFILFIKSLTKGQYNYQFKSFAWIHIVLILFGVSSSMIIANIFNGLIW